MQFNYSEGIPVKPQILAASLVLSSQIAGYSGGEVDSNATVDITFPIKVYESSFCTYKRTKMIWLMIIFQVDLSV